MLDPQGINGVMLQLPGHDARVRFVTRDNPGDVCLGRLQEFGVHRRLDQGVLGKGLLQLVRRNEKLRIAESFDWPDAKDDFLARTFGGFNLPIQLSRLEIPRLRLEPVPIGAQTDKLERVLEQLAQCGASI